ncbi:MAG: DLW-39 family protein [Micrococcales bacterium]|nr:DLW-39 family protein [Micrococcales bacterium]MCL2667735.1 DLW-39 family protein [Micrococcales bacterium]
MKKLLVLLVLAGIGYVAYRKFVQEQDERDLWAEVTDNL